MSTQKSKNINWNKKREDWISAVNDLFDEIKKWSKSRGWPVDVQQKDISEPYIGQYKISALFIQSPNGTIHVDPIGCNIIGAEGRVDILSFPSLNRVLLIRINNKWQVKTDSRIDWPQPWNEATFLGLVNRLTSI
jgi:hypothetical protein